MKSSSKDMASWRNLVSTIGAQANPTMGGRNQVSGRVSVPCWHATSVANAPWKPLIIGEDQARYQSHDIGGKSDWLGSHCWSLISSVPRGIPVLSSLLESRLALSIKHSYEEQAWAYRIS